MDNLIIKTFSDTLFIGSIIGAIIIIIDLAIAAFRYGIAATSSNKAMRFGVVKLIEQVSEKQFQNNQEIKIYDAGSGWGGLCFSISRKLPFRVIGIEGGLTPWLLAIVRCKAQQNDKVTFIKDDIHRISYESPCIVVAYLCMNGIQKLHQTLNNKNNQNIILISVAFAVDNTKPAVTYESGDWLRTPIYVYEF